MRAAILNTKDVSGGAARATHRIYTGLGELDIEVKLFVQRKDREDEHIVGPTGIWQRVLANLGPHLERAPLRCYRNRSGRKFTLGWAPETISSTLASFDPDIVHLNWIGDGFLNIRSIGKLNAPVVWRLPDMWAFTGGCHYSYGCERYTERCGRCPELGSQRSRDLSRLTWHRKARSYRDLDMVVVTPSTWLAERVNESSLMGNLPVEVIPNGLDTLIYHPVPSSVGRSLFKLDPESKVILFGAAIDPTGSSRKGFEQLRKALTALSEVVPDDEHVELVVFGTTEPQDPPEFSFDTSYVGYLYDDQSLAALYATADTMVVPSLYEGFGQTASEALACGTPVVAFDATGPSDIVDHQENGYLADAYDPEDLASGIWYTIADEERNEQLGEAARSKAQTEYDQRVIARRYLELYQSMVA